MRILYFTRSDSPHDQRFLTALAASKHEIFVLRLESVQPHTPAGVTELTWQGAGEHFRLIDLPRLALNLKKILREVRPDVIHAGPIQDVAFLVAVIGFKPLLSMSWGFDMMKDADQSWLTRCITKFTLNHTQILAADCQAVAEKAVSYGFERERMVLFPWGVDLSHFSPEDASRPGKVWCATQGWQSSFVVLSLRAWEPNYGVDDLVKAFVLAAQQESRLRLILLGTGSQRAMILRILEEGQVQDRVYFGGRVGFEDLLTFYGAADLYISSSHVDGSSVSLLEALACGLPALVSDIPGNMEWVTSEENGWLYPDGDHEALAKGVIRACNSNDLSRMAFAARQTALIKANWHENAKILIEAYSRLAEGDGVKGNEKN